MHFDIGFAITTPFDHFWRAAGCSPAGAPSFGLDLLDEALEVILKNGVCPFFGLMGNPSHYFTVFNDDRQMHHPGLVCLSTAPCWPITASIRTTATHTFYWRRTYDPENV